MPLIIWTLQRTGGTNFTQRLVERSGVPATEHEPFNLGRSFGSVTSAWLEHKDKEQLRQEIRRICQRRSTIKHCVELVPAELSEVLLEEASAAGYRHLFLYRKQARDRLLSLHFARQSGIWGPGSKPEGADAAQVFDEPLPVTKLSAHEQLCADLLTRLWNLSLKAELYPAALAFEDLYKAEPERAAVTLLPVLALLGLSRGPDADLEFTQQLLAKGNQGTYDKYGEFPGIDELDRKLAGLRLFEPTMPLVSLRVAVPGAADPGIARAVVDSFPPVFALSQTIEIGGVVVLNPPAVGGCTLTATNSGQVAPVSWSIASPKMKQLFPNSPNGAKARFHLKTTLNAGGTQIVLNRSGPGEPALAVFQLRLTKPSIEMWCKYVLGLGKLEADTVPGYAVLRATLDKASPAEHSATWLKASVWLDCLARKNARSAFQQLQTYRRMKYSPAHLEEFNAFYDRMQAAIHPYTLGPHGYIHALSSRPQAAVWRDINGLIASLASLGYECFINSGTLLGAVRDGKLIAHDDDVDLAVVLKADTLAGVVAEWLQLKHSLNAINLLNLQFEERLNAHAKIGRAGGAGVDLFPAWIIDDQVFVWPHTFGEMTRDELLPLRTMEIEGAAVRVPKDAEKMLVCNYGPGWSRRDPGFSFDWKKANKRFVDFLTIIFGKNVPE